MSQTYGTPSSGGAAGDGDQPTDWTTDSTRDVAAEEARGVAGDVKSAGQQTAATAKDQATQVAGEAKVQARQVYEQARQELDQQVQSQHQRAAGGLNALADELTGLVNGTGGQSGIAHDLAQQASDRVREAAQWLELRQPTEVLDEVRSFARRRPGAFLAAAAVAGLIGGRLTRGLADQAREDSSTQQYSGGGTSSGTGTYVAPVAVPGQRSYESAPVGMSTMPTPANTALDDPINDDALLTGTPLGDPLNDPLTDSSDTWAGESSQTYGEEKR
jgi:hypothetical protein